MLVVFIFRLLSCLWIMYFHLYLCIHLLSKIVFNLRSTLKSNKFYLFSIKLKTSKSITTKNWRNYKSRELTNSLVLKSRELEILVFHFSLYYNVSGGGMARRYWKIPSSSLGKKNLNSPLAAPPLVGNLFFSPWDSEGIFQYLLAIPPPF